MSTNAVQYVQAGSSKGNANGIFPSHNCDTVREKDSITVLTTRGSLLLTKTWLADGTIKATDRAKHFTVESVPVSSITELAVVLEGLQHQPQAGVIRGTYIGHDAAALVPAPAGEYKAGYVLRQSQYFTDPAHHWIMLDVDNYSPVLADAVFEPVEAIREFIRFRLPHEFREITFYYQLSSSAGHPSKEGTLRCHLWFFLTRPFTSPEAHAWVTMTKLPVDRAPLNVVQLHYTASPVMADDVVDPVPLRAGLVEGLFGDEVNVQVSEGALAVAMVNGRTYTPSGELIERNDPRLKRGLIGAFCRAFSPEDVLMADWFTGNFERVNERRWTWIDGHGAPEGCYITDDRLALVNTHNSAPDNTIGKGQNAYDVARLYMFGPLDEAVPEDDRWTWGAEQMSKPSEAAMRAFARTLPEVVVELEVATAAELDAALAEPDAIGSEPAPAENDSARHLAGVLDAIQQMLRGKRLTEDEIKRAIDIKALRHAWVKCFLWAQKNDLYALNREGKLLLLTQESTWTTQLGMAAGYVPVYEVLAEVARRTTTKVEDAAKLAADLNKAIWTKFLDHIRHHRQAQMMAHKIDMFATEASITMSSAMQATVVYTFTPFVIKDVKVNQPTTDAIVAEYKTYFPSFDTLLDAVLYARFARDRRLGFHWLHAPAGWGKGLLMDGVLGKDGLGLVVELSVPEIEKALKGEAVGFQLEDILRSWIMWVDEVRGVKEELKRLNNNIMAAPKFMPRFQADLYAKVFTSADGVESLAGAEGIERQFADRFNLWEVPQDAPVSDSLALLNSIGKARYTGVLANYAAHRFNAGVARLVAMGNFEASRVADTWMAELHKTQGIAVAHGLMEDNLPAVASELHDTILRWARYTLNSHDDPQGKIKNLKESTKNALSSSITVWRGSRSNRQALKEPEQLIAIRSPATLVSAWIEKFGRSQSQTLGKKVEQIITLLNNGKQLGATRYYSIDDADVITKHNEKVVLLTLTDRETLATQIRKFTNDTTVIHADFSHNGEMK